MIAWIRRAFYCAVVLISICKGIKREAFSCIIRGESGNGFMEALKKWTIVVLLPNFDFGTRDSRH